MHPKNISILDYTYHLPNDKIALHPLESRDASKLLIYKEGQIKEDVYQNIAQHLPEKSFLVFNNTKVIKARIIYAKPTGSSIEIFLLEPYNADYTTALSSTNNCQWKCFIGGISKWKESNLQLTIDNWQLTIELKEKIQDAFIVNFEWTGDISFAEILEQAGKIPLPPYIKRNADEEDTNRYQTIFAKYDGSVAAPTAGLHFTQNIFTNIEAKQIKKDFVTLHVGAGTFKPVKATTMATHEMHAEWIDVSITFIENLILNLDNTIVAVGTTSLRTIESLYWLGVKAKVNPSTKQLEILQWDVYDDLQNDNITVKEALEALLNWLQINNKTHLFTQTQIIIAPSYSFKIANAIITNFHQPQSTLLLLVAAAVGNNWKDIYQYALQNEFRFLSYGDGSLLWVER